VKKIFVIFAVCLLAILSAQAQDTKKTYADAIDKLRKNENAVYELTNLLTTDYTQVTNTSTVVPNSTFKMGESIVITSYGDAGINTQAVQMEAEFNKMFNGSTWKFSPESKNANSTVSVTTKDGQTETSNYGCNNSAMIEIGGLIQGLTMNITVSQSKADAKSFIFTFSPSNGLLVIMEVKK
jgi:hypothetical protein